MLGRPSVTFEGKPLLFPIQKAEALLYYVAFWHTVSKNEVSDMLWNGERANVQKNLRNALYLMRKKFGVDFIIPIKGGKLTCNPTLSWDCDVTADTVLEAKLKIYQDFLQGFEVKNADLFYEWQQSTRLQLKDIYLKDKKDDLISALQRGEQSEVERIASDYIREDPFDENIVRKLMTYFRDNKVYYKAAESYQQLHSVLGKELGITPMRETSALYHEILHEWNEAANDTPPVPELVKSRGTILRSLQKGYLQSVTGLSTLHFKLQAPAGMGKTFLLDYFLKNTDLHQSWCSSCLCKPAESNVSFSAWKQILISLLAHLEKEGIVVPHSILVKISSFFTDSDNTARGVLPVNELLDASSPQSMAEGVVQLLLFAENYRHLVLTFEDIHWMDTVSVDLLLAVMRQSPKGGLFVITTARPEEGIISKTLGNHHEPEIFKEINIQGFSQEECTSFVRHHWAGHSKDIDMDRIYLLTGGVPLLLVQLIGILQESGNLESLPSDKDSIFAQRLSGIRPDAQQVLDVISLFPNSAPYDLLEEIINKNPLDLLYICNDLKQRLIISECEDSGRIHLACTHQLLKEAVYERIPELNRRVMHLRIARVLEERYASGDSGLYSEIIYHYSQGKDWINAFRYKVINLDAYTDIHCDMMETEIYSNIHYGTVPYISVDFAKKYASESAISSYFDELFNEAATLRKTVSQQKLLGELELRLLHTKGRFYIYQGHYNIGVEAMEQLLKHTEITGNGKMKIRAHRNLVYYAIQTTQPSIMKEHLDAGMEIICQENDTLEQGIYCRLYGLYHIMMGAYDTAERFLLQSLTIFTGYLDAENKYLANIAYAHNYLGESYRRQGMYEKACSEFQLAIQLCSGKETNCEAILHCNYGQTLFAMGRYGMARSEFNKSEQTFNSFWGLTGRAKTLVYLALYAAWDGNDADSVEKIRLAESFSNTLGDRTEKTLLNLLKWYLKEYLSVNRRETGLLDSMLQDSAETYLSLAYENAKSIDGFYELEWSHTAKKLPKMLPQELR